MTFERMSEAESQRQVGLDDDKPQGPANKLIQKLRLLMASVRVTNPRSVGRHHGRQDDAQ